MNRRDLRWLALSLLLSLPASARAQDLSAPELPALPQAAASRAAAPLAVPSLTELPAPLPAPAAPLLAAAPEAPSFAVPTAPAVSVAASISVPSAASASAPAASVSAPRIQARRSQPVDETAFAQLARAAQTARRPDIPFEDILASHDVILIGESHQSLSSIETVTSALPRLARAGVRVVSHEALKRERQSEADRYLSGGPLPGLAALKGQRGPAWQRLYAGVRAAGLRLAGLDRDLGHWAREAAERAAQLTKEHAGSFAGELADQVGRAQATYEPGFNEAVAEVALERRNAAMAEALAAALRPGEKAVVIVGAAHVEHAPALAWNHLWLPQSAFATLADELAKRGLRAFSINVTGGLFARPQEDLADHRGLQAAAYRLVSQVEPSGARTFLPTSPRTALYHAGGRPAGQ